MALRAGGEMCKCLPTTTKTQRKLKKLLLGFLKMPVILLPIILQVLKDLSD